MTNGTPPLDTDRGTTQEERGTSTAPHRIGVSAPAVPSILTDEHETTSWAIASLGGGGAVIGYSVFYLVNRESGRAHQMHIFTGGLNFGFSASASQPSYTYFETPRPVSFADFDDIGSRLTSANIGIFFGYGITYLTLWDGPAYFSDQLAYLKMGGWAALVPGGGVSHGVTEIIYGSGARIGPVQLLIAPEVDDYVREPALASIRLAAQEDPRIPLPADLLFEFNSYRLKKSARPALLYLADLLNNRSKLPVEIEGHTDSIGSKRFNLDLSKKRAQAVKDWLIANRVYRAKEFRIVPFGESKPVAANTREDGSDNPEGRRLNRRVVVKGYWNV